MFSQFKNFQLKEESFKLVSRLSKTKLYTLILINSFDVLMCMHPCYFLLPISRESIVFGSNFRNGDFDGFTRFEIP